MVRDFKRARLTISLTTSLVGLAALGFRVCRQRLEFPARRFSARTPFGTSDITHALIGFDVRLRKM